ncbi:ADP-ribosylglycohydrolase [Acanthamoeba polyphaga moumouvirus]|uniref:ADP-ribosyltransferase n=2 Tax=Moumouvirus TaxID=3080801 RepID=L7RDH1_9VIRU|nr:ADP-ribosylglycohydrolase [Acanthamoeba polyphaga moumouvirus]AEX62577.1 putative ADP-ribosylglyco hydrolase [Moumouvirus Monve]AGC02108.1 ADP-ribosyltransferase [Acanthamoeba polyphaga moumouvirus]AQN68480.1 ADP-ribosyltransferase [Saudi moumouvirus]
MDISPKTRARYSILGAIVGDSLGSSFEFMKSSEVKNKLISCNYLNDGLIGMGPFELMPGQFTDDTEMALCIMSVIYKNNGEYNQQLVANKYHEWFLSNPFDIGNTTKNSVSQPECNLMINAAEKYNYQSMSNGSLMRLYGLVSMYYNRNIYDLTRAVSEDVILTHSHPEMTKISVIYSIALWKAIQGESVESIYNWIQSKSHHSDLIKSLCFAVNNNNDQFIYNFHTYELKDIDSKLFGFVGFALWLMLRCLKKYNNYRDAILYVVEYGGDTDTNACIVGAIMGALYPDTIPKRWIKNILECYAKKRISNFPIINPEIWTKWLP